MVYNKHNNTYSRAIKITSASKFKDMFVSIYNEDLEKIDNAFTYRETREVNGVNEISYMGLKFQVSPFNKSPLTGKRVEVRISSDG